MKTIFAALALTLACTALPCTAASSPQGQVRLEGYSLHDASGPFLALGASYMQALRHAKYDRARLDSNFALLASNGFNYLRILTMVSWDELEIAPVTFTNRNRRVVQAWPDYWEQFRALLEIAGRHGLRVEVTIFADAQYVMPSKAVRKKHMDGILAHLAGREHLVMHLEVANEAWQNGFPGKEGEKDLREFAQYLADRTDLLVAITSNDHESNDGIISLYTGSAADLATIHFSRDTRTKEGGWLPVRDSWRAATLPGVPPVSSNEPIGPGSSVAAESDPLKLCSAAIFAYIAKLPAYVYHAKAGIFGFPGCCPPSGAPLRFEDTAGINVYRHLHRILPRDLPNWVRNDGLEPAAPFTVFCNGSPNRYWPDVNGATNGCVRNVGSAKEKEFVCFPMGILPGGVTLAARRALRFQALNPVTGEVVSSHELKPQDRFTLPEGPRAYVLRGHTP